MFDFSTLITDRTLEDVAARNEKGSYNATDLNRVDACLEDLVARLNRVGCLVPGYVRVKIERKTKPSSRLPDGYTEVQYIQSSGTQYVDTGFQPNNNTKIEVDVKLTNTKCHVFGARTSWKNNAFALFWSSGASECVQLANQNFNGGTYDEKARHEISMTSTELRIDEKLNATYSVGAFQCNQTAWLMSCYSSSASEYATGNLYAAKIYDNGDLIRNYIPCIGPTGTAGLYDLVGGKFYGNSGTGVFLAGPPKATLPDGYTQLEYIQSSGKQYVDTGFKPNQNSRVICDFEFTSTTEEQTIFMARQSTSANMFGVFHNTSGWNYCYGAERIKGVTGVSITDRVKLDCNKEKASVNGSVLSAGTAVFTAPVNMTLFVRNTNGILNNYASAKLYACQAYDNGFLARDYIPCTNASGAAGLYDLVGQEFYGNAGTGSFTAGAAVTWPEEPDTPSDDLDPYTWYESDVPTVSLLACYRDNVAAVRAVLRLPEGTPGVPETMRRLTTAEANSIEAVLLAVDRILNHIPAAVRHCGVTVCGGKGVRA